MQVLYREYSIAHFCACKVLQLLRGIRKEHTEHGFRAEHPSRQVRLFQVPPVTAEEYQKVLVEFVSARLR